MKLSETEKRLLESGEITSVSAFGSFDEERKRGVRYIGNAPDSRRNTPMSEYELFLMNSERA